MASTPFLNRGAPINLLHLSAGGLKKITLFNVFFKVEIKPFALAKCREVTCSIRKSPQHQSCWVHGLRDMRCRVHERFYGTSENAVKTRIQIAVSLYVLVAIVRKRLELEAVSIRFVAIVRKRLELKRSPSDSQSHPF